MLIIDEVLYISRRYGVPYNITLDFLKNVILPYTNIVSIEEVDLNHRKIPF